MLINELSDWMNIETKFLNINDISAAKRFSTMDKESLVSYIGKVCLSLELEKDGAELKNVLRSNL